MKRPCLACGSRPAVTFGPTAGGRYTRCLECGLEQRIPEDGESSGKAFETAEAEFYGEQSLMDSSDFQRMSRQTATRRLKTIRRYIPSGRILEVGPGSGDLLREAQACGYTVAGVEYAQKFANRLRDMLGVTVHCALFEELDLSAERYDAVIGSHVIEHSPAPLQYLQAARRAVTGGGYLYVATPNAAGWGRRLAGNRWCGYSNAHLTLFTPRSLSLCLEQTGWEVIDARTAEDAYSWLRVLAGMVQEPTRRAAAMRAGSARDRSPRLIAAVTRVFAVFSWPFRRFQVAMGGGHELVCVARAVP